MALDETAAATATPSMTLYLDLAKFYDIVHLSTLLRTARWLEYPLRALPLCGQMFFAPRVIRVNGCFAAAIQPQTGTAPGSRQANHLARALWCDLLEKMYIVSPLMIGRHMWTTSCYESRRRHVTWVASRRQPPSSLYSPPPWNRMPQLGASGVSRVQPNGANKLRRVCTKLSRFQGLEHKRMCQSTNILPKAAYDTAVMGTAPHLAQGLHAHTIDSLGVLRGGRCASSVMMVLLKLRDPLAQAVLALVHKWLASWHLYPRHHGRPTFGWKRVARRLATTKPRARWRCATGPMAAMQLCLQDLG